LQELLTLFVDKGVAIQNAFTQNRHMKAEDLSEQLVSLLLPIDALLNYSDLNPRSGSSSELVTLFRNMWFLCTLFQFTVADEKDGSATEWRRPALSRIAAKTPPLVLEEAHDLLVSDVEFNSSIRLDYAHSVRTFLVLSYAAYDGVLGYGETSHVTQQVPAVPSRGDSIFVSRTSHPPSYYA
jgi:phosphatidylinositol 4-kinase A